jgi:hypothetical protein
MVIGVLSTNIVEALTNIQPTYTIFRVVKAIRTAGRPKMAASKSKGITGTGVTKKDITIRYNVKEMAAGRTTVPTSSIKTTNCIEKQNVPQRSRISTSSSKL